MRNNSDSSDDFYKNPKIATPRFHNIAINISKIRKNPPKIYCLILSNVSIIPSMVVITLAFAA